MTTEADVTIHLLTHEPEDCRGCSSLAGDDELVAHSICPGCGAHSATAALPEMRNERWERCLQCGAEVEWRELPEDGV